MNISVIHSSVHSMKYDAIIVGAGPAGLLAAKMIARKGFSVLVLEKDKDLGTRACAEAVSATAFETAEISPSQSLISNYIDGACVYPPDERKGVKIAGGSYKGYILNKPLFLYALAKEAVAAGSELMMRSEVKSISMTNGVAKKLVYEQKGEKHEVEFKVLVGADGVGSIVSRSCGFNTEGFDIISTIQYVMINCNVPELNTISIYMGNEVAPLGYVWVFSKNEYMANVGIGVRGKPAKPYLDKFIAAHPEFFNKSQIVKEGGGGVPVSGQLKEVVKGNVVLCGDCAGQVIPITGGGIRTSMGSGSIAGTCIANALESKDLTVIEDYPVRYNEYWGARISKSLKVLKAIETMTDEHLNMLGSLISGDDVIDLANGLDIGRVASKLMRHPLLAMKIASKLL